MRRWRVPALLCLALLAAGCGRTSAVKGRVLLDGRPVAGASVLFMPDAEGQGRPASGVTDDDGYFRLTTYRPGDGALPGTYRVLVSKSESPPAAQDEDHASKKRALDHLERMAARKRAKSPIPEVYADAEKTTLRCTVPASDVVKLELSGGGKP